MSTALQLDPLEARVLGVLIEKEFTTPEQYPLSLNALVNGCNQKSNREPEMAVSEHEASQAILRLRVAQLVDFVQMTGQRVEKYRQRAGGTLHLPPLELAVLAELLLRGPQQPNELARRAERMQPTATPEAVQTALDALIGKLLAVHLERRSGERFARYAQTLAPDPARGGRQDVGAEAARMAAGVVSSGTAAVGAPGDVAHVPTATVPAVTGLKAGALAAGAPMGGAVAAELATRLAALEAEVASLRERLRTLASRVGETLEPG